MCDVGVVLALGIEAGGLEDLLTSKRAIRGHGFRVTQGRLRGRSVALAISGPGGPAAARTTEALLDGHRPGWVISAGFAGGLDPRLPRHDILLVDSLANAQNKAVPIDLPPEIAALAAAPRVHVGRLLSMDCVVHAPEEKRRLGEEHQALAVDIETYSVAAVCHQRQVRFLAVRALSDAMEDRLPPHVERLLRQKTAAGRLGAALGSLWRRPTNVKTLWSLYQDAITTSDRLAGFLAEVVERLGPMPPKLPEA